MRKDSFQKLLLQEIKVARPLVLFKAFRHDKEIKQLLGIKKLRKDLFYEMVDNNFLIHGSGSLVVTDSKTAEVLVNRIKRKLRYAKESF